MDQTRFQVGQRVKVKNLYPPGHIRTCPYVRGKTGVVSRYFGRYKNPELLAYGKDGLPLRELYWVEFRVNDLWEHKPGKPQDKLRIEIYEHWLEPA